MGGDLFNATVFQDQVVIVTGGGTGLGRATAEFFGRHGARVAILGRRQTVIDGAEREMARAGITVLGEPLDIRDSDAVGQFVDKVWSRWGRIDVLVNNAGGQFPKEAMELTPRGLDAVIRTNLYGTINMSQAVARRMVGSGGVIINIVISALERGIPGVAHTVAARAGVVGYMRTVAREWGPYGIRVNAVGPGLVVTPGFEAEMLQTGDPAVVERTRRAIPLGRLGTPEDIVPVVAFLASPGASYITGQYVTVDGGNSLAEGISMLPEKRISTLQDE